MPPTSHSGVFYLYNTVFRLSKGMEAVDLMSKNGYTLSMDPVVEAGFERLVERTREYFAPERLLLLKQAYLYAAEAHEGQQRQSGEPYLMHPLETALILAEHRLDANSLVAALLHDVPEDCGIPLTEIEAAFGPDISKLVDGVTKLTRLSAQISEDKGWRESLHAESLRKMLVAMAEDVRVVFIKLADRLHNMRTLGALSQKKRRSIAGETLAIYAPLAHRLGIWQVKGELEDLAFSCTQPRRYQQVRHLVARHQIETESSVARAIEVLDKELKCVGLKAEISGRTKNLYSIYQKIEKYDAQGRGFGDIHDVIAVRVLMETTADCYHALGVVHQLWHPISGEFDDYIANPKDNGYQSLHTSVMCFGTTPLEIQIRTYEMHRNAEYGVAAHWRYKEQSRGVDNFEHRISWLRQLLEWHKEMGGTAEFLESVKTDVLTDRVFVYTPKGDIKELPSGSTPVDFAYLIHTDLGHRCVGAQINGKLSPLTYQLHSGDTVKVIASKAPRGPSRDWLNSNLGYVKTSYARGKIRLWFKKQGQAESIEKGKEILGKELHRLGLSPTNRLEIAHLFKCDTLEAFYGAIGYGEINPSRISARLVEQQEQPRIVGIPTIKEELKAADIKVLGVGQLLTNLARCCNPLPGDEIIGYVTRSRGVTIHRMDCHNITRVADRERLVLVEWGRVTQVYPVTIRVDGSDRVGLLRDISMAVSDSGVNMCGISSVLHDDGAVTIYLALMIKSVSQLSHLLAKIEALNNVLDARRTTENIGGLKGAEETASGIT